MLGRCAAIVVGLSAGIFSPLTRPVGGQPPPRRAPVSPDSVRHVADSLRALEQAWGRDRAFEAGWQPITGIGAAVNLRAPWNTILRADFGKSFLPDRYNRVGSTTLQIMFLKPLG